MDHVSKSLFLLFFIFSIQLYAYVPSEGNVTASYGAFLYKTNFSGSENLPNSPILGDFGLKTNGDLNENGSLEIALFHLNKIYYRNLNNRNLTEQTSLIHITMGYRRWLSEKFSVGLGFYAGYSLGDYTTIHNDSNVNLEIDTSARDTVEYGYDFSAQQELWSKEKEAVTLDLRYSYSISNKENEKGDHYGLFLAYRVFIQEKESNIEAKPVLTDEDFQEPRIEEK
jgi:hypothetical protein